MRNECKILKNPVLSRQKRHPVWARNNCDRAINTIFKKSIFFPTYFMMHIFFKCATNCSQCEIAHCTPCIYSSTGLSASICLAFMYNFTVFAGDTKIIGVIYSLSPQGCCWRERWWRWWRFWFCRRASPEGYELACSRDMARVAYGRRARW